jgi:hypothetical protein
LGNAAGVVSVRDDLKVLNTDAAVFEALPLASSPNAPIFTSAGRRGRLGPQRGDDRVPQR